MFNSIKEWIQIPYVLKSFIKVDGAGAKEYLPEETKLCYPVGEIEEIADYRGATVISNAQLYVPGDTTIKVQDLVIFEGLERTIHTITTFYRGSVPDIKVVYL